MRSRPEKQKSLCHAISELTHNVDNELPKSNELFLGCKETPAEVCKAVLHQYVPGQVQRILLGNALVTIHFRNFWSLFRELRIGNTTMVTVTIQRKERP